MLDLSKGPISNLDILQVGNSYSSVQGVVGNEEEILFNGYLTRFLMHFGIYIDAYDKQRSVYILRQNNQRYSVKSRWLDKFKEDSLLDFRTLTKLNFIVDLSKGPLSNLDIIFMGNHCSIRQDCMYGDETEVYFNWSLMFLLKHSGIQLKGYDRERELYIMNQNGKDYCVKFRWADSCKDESSLDFRTLKHYNPKKWFGVPFNHVRK